MASGHGRVFAPRLRFARLVRFSDIGFIGSRVRSCAGFSDAGGTVVPALRRPASEKRQGRKSLRDRPLRRAAGPMGIWCRLRGLEGWRVAIEAVGLAACMDMGIGAKGRRVGWAVRVGVDGTHRTEIGRCRR